MKYWVSSVPDLSSFFVKFHLRALSNWWKLANIEQISNKRQFLRYRGIAENNEPYVKRSPYCPIGLIILNQWRGGNQSHPDQSSWGAFLANNFSRWTRLFILSLNHWLQARRLFDLFSTWGRRAKWCYCIFDPIQYCLHKMRTLSTRHCQYPIFD